ncbi:class I adenylate-forming enzyme family protein [Palleronia abyssalis]|uniref:Long-chain-fatty-acid--CoA ligase n=1 Tax=Palleronia abyssalis TaxID=1501240 RepID=A0A2R8BQ92_9RHOB|nr:class I adenylate-forming enzyme family protein [Palleronia abyssalis]SPJ22268.1 Long-chain-fatty-acid--CoA ligase [Palleronia abyssalis]
MRAVSLTEPLPPPPRPFNMAAHVLRHAGRLAEKPALVQPDGDIWTFGSLLRAVQGTASGLLSLGLKPGDRVALRLGNTVDVPIAYLGALAAGLVPVPTSAALTASEITPMTRALNARLVVASDKIALPDAPEIPVLYDTDLRRFRTLPSAPFHMGDPERPGYIVFTSGTGASPRGVIHAHRAVWARQSMIAHWAAMTQSDRVLHAGTFNWTYTMGTGLMDPWSVGATAIIPNPDMVTTEFATLIADQSATILAAVPGIYRRLLDRGTGRFPALRHGLSAGEKLPETIRAAWRTATGTEIHEAYGQSECSTFISGAPHAPAPPGSLGRAQPGRRVAILAPDGPVGRGEVGALAVARGDPGLMLGYLDEPDDAISGEWRKTGDLASMDDDGWITYLGRDDDVMTAGGYRVSPLEIEGVALGVEGVKEAAAFELEVKPDVRVIALAYIADGDREDQLTAAFASHLAGYKRPRILERRDTLPRNPNGKLQRRLLRDGGSAPRKE